MKIFFSRSCGHLIQHFQNAQRTILSQFPDGELHMVISSSIQSHEIVWVIASTLTSESIVELLMMLDILSKKGARINVLLTYASYLRMDQPTNDETFFGKTIFKLINTFNVEKIVLLHPHTMNLNLDNVHPVIWDDFFINAARDCDLLVAPDEGARSLVATIGKIVDKKTISLHKMRNNDGTLTSSIPKKLAGERVLIIDDIVSTGQTIIRSAEILKQAGASLVNVAATHGIFCADAYEQLTKSALNLIYVTDSLPQKNAPQVRVVSLEPLIKKIILQ